MRMNSLFENSLTPKINPSIVVIFLSVLCLLFQSQPARCQDESSTIGNFYREFLGSPAKIAARESTMTNKYRQMLADLNVNHDPLINKLAEKIIDSPQSGYLKLPTTIEGGFTLDNPELKRQASTKKRPDHVVRIVTVKVTAYYGPEPGQDKYFHKTFEEECAVNGKGKITSSGTKPRIGTIATDQNVFPEGTELLAVDPLDGLEKIFTAEDKGRDIKGLHIDMFMGWGEEGYQRVKKMMRADNTITVKVLKVSA